MKERTRLHERYISQLIAESVTTNLDKLIDAENINCYAAARMLTYPDPHKQYYAPGRIYQLQKGFGNFVKDEINPSFIHKCIMMDSKTLNQPCTRVAFSEIVPEDGYHYFGICHNRLVIKDVKNPTLRKLINQAKGWHFIFRLPTGNWLHKPGFEEPIECIDWEVYGKKFFSTAYNQHFPYGLPVEITVCEDYFYRLDNKYKLSVPEGLLEDSEQSFFGVDYESGLFLGFDHIIG